MSEIILKRVLHNSENSFSTEAILNRWINTQVFLPLTFCSIQAEPLINVISNTCVYYLTASCLSLSRRQSGAGAVRTEPGYLPPSCLYAKLISSSIADMKEFPPTGASCRLCALTHPVPGSQRLCLRLSGADGSSLLLQTVRRRVSVCSTFRPTLKKHPGVCAVCPDMAKIC